MTYTVSQLRRGGALYFSLTPLNVGGGVPRALLIREDLLSWGVAA